MSHAGKIRRGTSDNCVYVCAVIRQCLPSGCKSRPANSVAPAGSYRSGGGGNETVEAFETYVPLGGAASRQAVTRMNAEQASKDLTWEPTRHIDGEGRRRWRTGKRVE
jgi:hypothetical protein